MASDDASKGSATLDRHVAGTTQRWTFDSGPTAGKTYEHVFGADGTVTFREVKADDGGSHSDAGKKPEGKEGGDRPRYGAAHIADGIHAVSYLSKAGYTLTVVLNERDHSLHGFASSDKEWYQLEGRFERVD